MELSEKQQEQHDKWGWEFYEEDGNVYFSQVRTNMMEYNLYTPYCMRCTSLQRFGKFDGEQMTCPKCGGRTAFPKEFIDRFKAKHNIK